MANNVLTQHVAPLGGSRLTVGPLVDNHFLLLYMKDQSRCYQLRDSEGSVLDAVMRLFEANLATKRGVHIDDQLDPPSGSTPVPPGSVQAVQYDASDLLDFVDDGLAELAVMRYDPAARSYIPYGSDWVKSRLLQALTEQCAGPSGLPSRAQSANQRAQASPVV